MQLTEGSKRSTDQREDVLLPTADHTPDRRPHAGFIRLWTSGQHPLVTGLDTTDTRIDILWILHSFSERKYNECLNCFPHCLTICGCINVCCVRVYV